MLNSNLDLNFDVIEKTVNSRYVNCIDTRLVKTGPVALFCNFKLTKSSGNHLEDFNHGHLVSLFYKLIN